MEKDYRFEVFTDYSSGKKEYVVQYYDFDSVIGSGITIEEAINEAKSNLEYYISYCKDNNIFIPEPSTHDEIDYSGKVTLRMSKSLHKKVDLLSKKEGVSMNSFLCEAIQNYVLSKNMSFEFIQLLSDDIRLITEEYFDKVYNYKIDESSIKRANFNFYKQKSLAV